MRKIYSFRNSRPLFGLLFLMLSIGVWGQTILQYPLNSNLTPDIGPAVGLNPQINYFSPPSTVPVPLGNLNFGGNTLNFVNSGDYLQVTFDATDFEGLTLESRVGLWGIGFASGNVKVYMKIGSNPEELLPNGNVDLDYFLFGSEYHTFSLPLSSADGESQVTIRIVGTSSSFAFFDGFGIDFFRLVSNNTTMNVRRFNPPNTTFPIINHNSSASVTLDTDYGDLLTNEGSSTKRFRITNTGSRTLNINNMSIQPNDQGFELEGTIPTSVPVGGQGYFEVKFAPESQGMKLANVVINSNAIPDNPFSFQVIGRGKSCNTAPVSIAFQHFEPEGGMQSNLDMQIMQGSPSTIGGTGASPINSPVTRLYPNSNLYSSSSPNRSLYIRGNQTNEVEMEFGPVDITGQTEVSIAFNVAAFGQTNDDKSGVNNSDYVILSVYNPSTNTWSDEVRLNGSINSTRRKYNFETGIYVPLNYDGNNSPHVRSNFQTNNTYYGSFQLAIPPSFGSNTLRFKIKAYTSQTRTGSGLPWDPYQYHNNNFWLIDNVRVNAGNAIVKTWNGSSWTGGNNPTSRERVVFNGNYNFSGTQNQDLEMCECLVMWDKNITIPEGRTMTIRNRVDIQGSGNNFVIKTGGNLIQIEDNATNTGIIKVERDVFDIDVDMQNQMDYVYWGSPVGGQKLRGTAAEGGFSPGTPSNRFFELREPQNMFFSTPDNEFLSGKGYSIRAENGLGISYDKTYIFKGTPNNGWMNSPLISNQNEGYNLIGNPYPSNINADAFFALNAGKIYNTVLFWGNKGYTQHQQGSNYSGNNYVVYNGGTGGIPSTEYEQSYEISTKNVIQVAQGFLVKAKPAGEGLPIEFNNSLRVKNAGEFYQKYEKDRFWLTMGSPNDTYNTILVGYILGASNEFDEDFDVNPLYEDTSDVLYSHSNNQKMVIQGRDFPLNREDVVPLGANFFQEGKYKIYLRGAEGIFAGEQKIYLKDKYSNKIHNLSDNGAYEFKATEGNIDDRFEIIYKRRYLSASSEASLAKNNISISKFKTDIIVSSNSSKIISVEVYDLAGRRIFEEVNVNQSSMKIPIYDLAKQIVIVRAMDELGVVETKKLILQ